MKSCMIVVTFFLFLSGFYPRDVDGSTSPRLTRLLRSKSEPLKEERGKPLMVMLAKLYLHGAYSLPDSAFQNLDNLLRPEYRETMISILTNPPSGVSLFSLVPETISEVDIASKIYTLKDDELFYSKLQNELISFWLAEKSIAKVVKKFADAKFPAGSFALLELYVQKYYEKFPHAVVSLYQILRKDYSSQEFFAIMSDHQVKPTSVLSYIWPPGATISFDDSLQLTDLFEYNTHFQHEGKITIEELLNLYDPDRVVKVLEYLDKAGAPIIADKSKVALLKGWQHGGKAYDKFADKLKRVLVTKWRHERKTSVQVFHLLDFATNPASSSPWVHMWLLYVTNDVEPKGGWKKVIEELKLDDEMLDQVLVSSMMFTTLRHDAEEMLKIQFRSKSEWEVIDIIANAPTIPLNEFSWFSLLPETSNYGKIAKGISVLGQTNKDRSKQLRDELIQYWVTTYQPIKRIVRDFSTQYKTDLFDLYPLGLMTDYIEHTGDQELLNIGDLLYQILRKVYTDKAFFEGFENRFRLANSLHVKDKTFNELVKLKFDDMLKCQEQPAKVLGYFRIGDVYVSEIPKVWVLYLSAFSEKYKSQDGMIVDELLSNYGVYRVVKLLDLVEKNGKAKLANDLKLALLGKWRTQRKTNDEVLNLINFRGQDIRLSYPQINMWVLYMKDAFPDEGAFIKYLDGVKPQLEPLVYLKALITWSEFHNFKDDATSKIPDLIEQYFTKVKPNPAYSLELFNFDKDIFLTNPYFKLWLDYAVTLDTQWIKSILIDKYGLEKLANVINKGLQHSDTEVITFRLKLLLNI